MSGTFTSLRHKMFRYFWMASLLSYIGTWMHIVAAGWLMTSLTSSASLIALLQTAMTLPVFFFSIPAGMIADFCNLKKFLCVTQTWMGVTAITLSILTFLNLITPIGLLIITFILGIGSAVNVPPLATAISTMVPEEDLRGAITLNSMSYNAARLLGPAIGGYCIILKGPSLVFILDAVSFLCVIYFFSVCYKVKPHPSASSWNLRKSLAGFGIILKNPYFNNLLKRTACFFLAGSSVWSLAPIIAKSQLGEGVTFYAHFIMYLGIGAVFGGLCLAFLRAHFSKERLLFASSLVFLLMLSLIALTQIHGIIYGALIMIGFTWISTASTFTSLTLELFPEELKSRAFALYWIVFNGSLALGSAFWGKMVSLSTLSLTLLSCSALVLIGTLITIKWKLEPNVPSL